MWPCSGWSDSSASGCSDKSIIRVSTVKVCTDCLPTSSSIIKKTYLEFKAHLLGLKHISSRIYVYFTAACGAGLADWPQPERNFTYAVPTFVWMCGQNVALIQKPTIYNPTRSKDRAFPWQIEYDWDVHQLLVIRYLFTNDARQWLISPLENSRVVSADIYKRNLLSPYP